MQKVNKENSINATKKCCLDKGGTHWILLGLILPLIGFIIFLVYRKEQPYTAKLSGRSALISFLLSFLFGFFVVIGEADVIVMIYYWIIIIFIVVFFIFSIPFSNQKVSFQTDGYTIYVHNTVTQARLVVNDCIIDCSNNIFTVAETMHGEYNGDKFLVTVKYTSIRPKVQLFINGDKVLDRQ